MTQLCLLCLSGSLHRASNRTAVLRGLQDALAPRFPDYFHKAVGYVDQILKGANLGRRSNRMKQHDFRYWHEADITVALMNFRY